ncbi:MAG: hypothetical protein WD993_08210 [Thermoleophilaceae bacterium]
MSRVDGVMVEIDWAINPFRGDKFELLWTPAAEAALDYGATSWSLLRSQEGGLDFIQLAHFPTKDDFERYWYSEEIAAARVQCAGLFQVPLLPKFHTIAGAGTMAGVTT